MRGFGRAKNCVAVGLPGQNHAHGPGELLLDSFQEFRAIHARHTHVADHHIKGGMSHGLQSLAPAQHKLHLPFFAHGAKTALQSAEHHGVVVDE